MESEFQFASPLQDEADKAAVLRLRVNAIFVKLTCDDVDNDPSRPPGAKHLPSEVLGSLLRLGLS